MHTSDTLPRPYVTADERDAYSPFSRRPLRWRPGEIRSIKTRTHRRERRDGRIDVRDWR